MDHPKKRTKKRTRAIVRSHSYQRTVGASHAEKATAVARQSGARVMTAHTRAERIEAAAGSSPQSLTLGKLTGICPGAGDGLDVPYCDIVTDRVRFALL